MDKTVPVHVGLTLTAVIAMDAGLSRDAFVSLAGLVFDVVAEHGDTDSLHDIDLDQARALGADIIGES